MGEKGSDWGAGSVQAIKDMDNVHRLAWFAAHARSEEFHSAMFNDQGELLPIARALFNDLDPSKVDCTA